MKTDDEMLGEINGRLRDMRLLETHTWEKYDVTGEERFMSALAHLGRARIELSRVKQLFVHAHDCAKKEG